MGECYLGGRLFNPEKVYELGAYLPYSEPAHLLTLAHTDNFVADSLSWGQGSLPITLQGYKSLDITENAIDIDAKTSGGECGYVDLGVAKKPCTVYAVVKKNPNSTGVNNRLVMAFERKGNFGGAGVLAAAQLQHSLWNSGLPFNPSRLPDSYHAIAFRYDGTRNYYFNVSDSKVMHVGSVSYNDFGRYITIGRTIPTALPTSSNENPTDVYVKFLSIIDTPESEEIIDNNILFLMSKYGIVV